MFLENMKKCDEIAYQKGVLEGQRQKISDEVAYKIAYDISYKIAYDISYQEGLLEGKQEGKLEIAQAMLAKGFEVSLVVELTGLAVEVVESLRH